MKLVAPAALLFVLCASHAAAQKSQSLGYWFIAPGAVSGDTTLHLGGGGELALPGGFGLAFEGGALGLTRTYRQSLMAVGSANGVYHPLAGRWERLDPFATAGYSAFIRRGTASLVNYGFGMNWWFSPPLGLRVEFRDHYHSASGTHSWGFRFGLSFTELLP